MLRFDHGKIGPGLDGGLQGYGFFQIFLGGGHLVITLQGHAYVHIELIIRFAEGNRLQIVRDGGVALAGKVFACSHAELHPGFVGGFHRRILPESQRAVPFLIALIGPRGQKETNGGESCDESREPDRPAA